MCAPEGEACKIQCGADTCRRGEYCYYTSAAHCMECEDESGDHNVCTRCHEPYSVVGGECVYLEQVALDKIAAMITENSGKECVAPQLPNTQSQNCGSFSVGLDDNKLHVDYLFAGKYTFVFSCSCIGIVDVSLTTFPSEIGYLTSLTMLH